MQAWVREKLPRLEVEERFMPELAGVHTLAHTKRHDVQSYTHSETPKLSDIVAEVFTCNDDVIDKDDGVLPPDDLGSVPTDPLMTAGKSDLMVPTRSDTELKELQRHVENGWSFPRDTLQLSPLSVTLFLLKCLEVLPTPLLPAILVQDAAGDAKKISSTLRSLPELSRVVLLTPAPEPAVQLILALSDEVKAEKRFPPLETFKRHGT
eukprot:g24643.t1